MSTPVLFKVNTKKNKKEPCRICNTKTRPCIDLIKNSELLKTVNSALGLIVSINRSSLVFDAKLIKDLLVFQVSPDTRLSKAICVVCMSLVRMFDEFKKVCFDNQNDLWKMEQHLVKDRGSAVVELLLRAKSTSIPGHLDTHKPPIESVLIQSDQSENLCTPETERAREQVLSTDQEEYDWNESEITLEEEMVEEHLEDSVDPSPPIRFMCTNINCDRLFETKEEMSEHLQSHKIIRSRSKPYTSTRRNETIKEDAYTCQVCKKVFEDVSGLVQHRKMNHFPKKCGFCGIAMPSESFTAHQAQCKKENAKRMGILEPKRKGGIKSEITPLPPDTFLYKCGLCDSKYKTVESYKQHAKSCFKPG